MMQHVAQVHLYMYWHSGPVCKSYRWKCVCYGNCKFTY